MVEYNAKVLKVVDGDTIDAWVDLGFDTWKKVRIRMHGINAPESRTRDKEEKKRGLAAKARLIEILNEVDNKFVLVSYGVGKFGRCLGDIRIPDIVPDSFKSVNSQLIMEGHGTEYYGGKR